MSSGAVVTLALAVVGAAPVAVGVPDAVGIDHVLRHRLDNGLTVLLEPNRSAPVVAMQAWVEVGSADEPSDVAGIAHVFEHMLFKGTPRRGVGVIAQDIEAAGGDINAWTSFNQTVYHVVLGSRFFDTGLDVLADALQNASFDAGELEREREVILEELKQGEDDPSRTVAQTLFATAFTRHPYRRPVIGSVESVRALDRDKLVSFFGSWYVADNTTLVIAGDFEPDRALARVAADFGSMRSAHVPRRRHVEPRQTRPRAAVVTHDVHEAQLSVGFHIPAMNSAATAPLDLLAVALGQGESSRLNLALRREQEVVSHIYAFAHSLRDSGLFVIGASTPPERAERAIEGVLAQLQRVIHEELDERELDKARRVIEADLVYQQETAQGAARKYGLYEVVAGNADFEADYLAGVRGASLADLRRVAEEYLSVANATLVSLLPHSDELATPHGRARRAERLLALADDADAAARSQATPRRAVQPPGELVRETLPNGLRVIVKRDTTVPIVAMRAVWAGGLRYETRDDNGVHHLVAALLTRGCGARSAEQIALEVDDMAAVLSGFSGRNSLGLRGEWLAEDWERGFDLMASCIREPRFPSDEVQRERRRVLDELDARKDNPGYLAFRSFAQALYPSHPYRLDVLGTRTSIGRLSRKRIADFYASRYPVGEMTLAVVGDVEPARVLRRVRAAFGDVSSARGARPRVPGERFHGDGPREVYHYLDRQQAHLVVGFPGTTVDDGDRYALEVMVTILSGQGGRLFLELRDRRGLAYRVAAFSVEGIDPGYLAVYVATGPDKLAAAHAAIRAELDALVAAPPSQQEVERAVRYLVGTHDISLQRRSSVASAIAFHEAYGLGYDAYTRYAASVEAVTPADVQRVAKEYLDWDAAVIATVRPPAMSPEAVRRARGERKRRTKAKKGAQ